jgi:ABC-type transport system involved in cytochrome c biogenesis permease subunit
MKHVFLIAIFIILQCATGAAFASDALPCGAIRNIPVLHEGRLKPFDSFARIHLRTFSGKPQTKDMDACAWLAESLFDPAAAATRPIYEIRNPELARLLGINEQQTHYALTDLESGLEKTAPQIETLLQQSQDTLTKTQQDLLTLHSRVAQHHEIMRSLSLILPLDVALPESLAQAEASSLSFLSLQNLEPRARAALDQILAQKGSDPTRYTKEEQALVQLLFDLDSLRTGGQASAILRIIPAPFANQNDLWVSPWMMVEQGQGSPENGVYLGLWQIMAHAYRNHDAAAWIEAQQNAQDHIQARSMSRGDFMRFSLERLYNQIKPYETAILFYVIAFFAMIFAAFKTQKTRTKIYAEILSLSAFATALLLHTGAITARIVILSRPPVGTLYESLLFVSLICAAIGLTLFLRSKNRYAIITGSIAGAGLLALAPGLLQQGESLELLVAVLNTNFWLGTHVLCITAGYAVCVMAGLFAHLSLYFRALGNTDDQMEETAYRISLAALLLCTVGTILGGIWADQSWGRFWGWDPKENGALLIVLWLLWAQHGRLSAHLNRVSFLVALAFLNVIVALAWFGVNLMGVGLHAYGFTTGIATALGLFCLIEIVIISALWGLAAKRRLQNS